MQPSQGPVARRTVKARLADLVDAVKTTPAETTMYLDLETGGNSCW